MLFRDMIYPGENPGCFGAQKKKEKGGGSSGFGLQRDISGPLKAPGQRSEPLRGMELLWQPEVRFFHIIFS